MTTFDCQLWRNYHTGLLVVMCILILRAPFSQSVRGSAVVLQAKAKADQKQEGESTLTEEGENYPTGGVNSTKSQLTGIPQIDYLLDPNLPRELNGHNLTDYPFYNAVPEEINFKCDGLHDGFYASVEHKCQVYHHCLYGTRYDFLCANYTAFDQRTFICHFVSEIDCDNSPKFFNRNEALYKAAEPSTTSTTTTTTTTTRPTTPSTVSENKGNANNRRRRPHRRRRPIVYEYYYDDEEDDGAGDGGEDYPSSHSDRRREPAAEIYDYYEDEEQEDPVGRRYIHRHSGTASGTKAGNHRRSPAVTNSRRNRLPNGGSSSSNSETDINEKDDRIKSTARGSPSASATASPSSSVYDRPRTPPKIPRPVPKSEKNKYEYNVAKQQSPNRSDEQGSVQDGHREEYEEEVVEADSEGNKRYEVPDNRKHKGRAEGGHKRKQGGDVYADSNENRRHASRHRLKVKQRAEAAEYDAAADKDTGEEEYYEDEGETEKEEERPRFSGRPSRRKTTIAEQQRSKTYSKAGRGDTSQQQKKKAIKAASKRYHQQQSTEQTYDDEYYEEDTAPRIPLEYDQEETVPLVRTSGNERNRRPKPSRGHGSKMSRAMGNSQVTSRENPSPNSPTETQNSKQDKLGVDNEGGSFTNENNNDNSDSVSSLQETVSVRSKLSENDQPKKSQGSQNEPTEEQTIRKEDKGATRNRTRGKFLEKSDPQKLSPKVSNKTYSSEERPELRKEEEGSRTRSKTVTTPVTTYRYHNSNYETDGSSANESKSPPLDIYRDDVAPTTSKPNSNGRITTKSSNNLKSGEVFGREENIGSLLQENYRSAGGEQKSSTKQADPWQGPANSKVESENRITTKVPAVTEESEYYKLYRMPNSKPTASDTSVEPGRPIIDVSIHNTYDGRTAEGEGYIPNRNEYQRHPVASQENQQSAFIMNRYYQQQPQQPSINSNNISNGYFRNVDGEPKTSYNTNSVSPALQLPSPAFPQKPPPIYEITAPGPSAAAADHEFNRAKKPFSDPYLPHQQPQTGFTSLSRTEEYDVTINEAASQYHQQKEQPPFISYHNHFSLPQQVHTESHSGLRGFTVSVPLLREVRKQRQ